MRKQKDCCGHFNKIQLSSERKLLRHHGKIDHESAVCPLKNETDYHWRDNCFLEIPYVTFLNKKKINTSNPPFHLESMCSLQASRLDHEIMWGRNPVWQLPAFRNVFAVPNWAYQRGASSDSNSALPSIVSKSMHTGCHKQYWLDPCVVIGLVYSGNHILNYWYPCVRKHCNLFYPTCFIASLCIKDKIFPFFPA